MAKSVGSASKSQTTGKRAGFTAESTVVTEAARMVGATPWPGGIASAQLTAAEATSQRQRIKSFG